VWHGEHSSSISSKHATIEELLEAVFSVWSMPVLHKKDQQQSQSVSLMEMGLNISTIALQVIVDNKNGVITVLPCSWGI
jgi:hypothetical protein